VHFENHRYSLLSTSLRVRLIISITVVLLMILLPGSALVYWHAVHEVDVELRAAATVGANTVHNALDDAEEAERPRRRLELLIADFDGDRHLRATLVDPAGKALFRSTPLRPSDPAPDWFYRLLARRAVSLPIALPAPFDSFGSIVLQTDAHNEIGEVWDDALLTLVILILFCGMNAALVYWITGRALRPLETLSAAFDRLGAGNFHLRVPELGPREFARVTHGLNRLAAQLADAESRRIRLERQLTAVQEEERAELARDLHDEVGPLLFAVGVDLSVIQHDEAIENTALESSVIAARESISRIYGEIKKILGRLRTASPAELGLSQAVEKLLSFWRARYPSVQFFCEVPEEGFDPVIDDAVYHVIMESLSNALRHGTPSRLDVLVALDDDHVIASVRDDGGGFAAARGEPGFGLTSMDQRVGALGGSLRVGASPDQDGVMVTARIPILGSAQAGGAQKAVREMS
jgi:two-component system, NarL family, sensor histidine kinase UhpB